MFLNFSLSKTTEIFLNYTFLKKDDAKQTKKYSKQTNSRLVC